MPVYTYECPICKRESEIFHSMTLNPAYNCPHAKCDKAILRRVLSGNIGVHFRGAGFSSVDYPGTKVAQHRKPFKAKKANNS